MPDSGSEKRPSVRLKGILDGTASWVRILADGRVELEYYDHSSAAHGNFGNDVAWMYRIAATEKPRLFELLEKHTGIPVTDDQTMLDALALTFRDTWQVKDWLKEKAIPYDEEFDSWA